MKIRIAFPVLLISCFLPGIHIAQMGDVHPIMAEFRQEILDLRANRQVMAAFDWIAEYDGQSTRDLVRLTEIPAPPFKEQARASALADMFIRGGADSVWTDAVGNVIALRKGTERDLAVALDAHTDTVFPEGTDVTVHARGDTLFAPGIGDDTRGVAMLVAILKAMVAADMRTQADVLFIGSVGEEGLGDLRGVKYLFGENGPGIDSWISIDGGEVGRVNCRALGSIRYRVHFKGPGGHSWGAFGLANPHHALGSAIHYFVEQADAFTAYGPRTSYNVGVIAGGTSVNSVPYESVMEVDIRSVDPLRLDTMANLLEASVSQALNEQNGRMRIGDPLSVDLTRIGDRPSGELSPELPLVQRAMAATASFGKPPRLTRGSTNSNIPISKGIPAVTIGRGGKGANAHALDEWWLNDKGYEASQMALLLLVAEAGLPSE